MRAQLFALLAVALQAQTPAFLAQLPPVAREEALDIMKRADFVFETHTQPKHVRLATMEKLFDHPRLGAAMWRNCKFVPSFYAFTHPDGAWSIDDTKGNIATFGEFADLNPADFRGALKRDGDAVALREFELIFQRR